MKTHLKLSTGAACGRGNRTTDNVWSVSCLVCQKHEHYVKAMIDAVNAREAAFQAQTPRTVVPQFGRVNEDGVMECPDCAGILWRERPRSLFSFHYVCEGCGRSVHPMTETGMSS